MSPSEQLALWLLGISKHKCTPAGDCVPDFSCCRPHLKWPPEERKRFIDHPEDREGMLMQALGALLADAYRPGEVYLIGREIGHGEQK